MPNQIAILRDATGRLALFVNGQRSIRGGQGQLALLACLLDNLGRAVPYKRLFAVIGRKSDNGCNRHLLRQYMLVLRVMLLANKAPFKARPRRGLFDMDQKALVPSFAGGALTRLQRKYLPSL